MTLALIVAAGLMGCSGCESTATTATTTGQSVVPETPAEWEY